MSDTAHFTAEQARAAGARAHLNEFPDYYTRLERMEEEARRERGPQ